MPIYDVDVRGEKYQIDAPDDNAAMEAIRSLSGGQQQPQESTPMHKGLFGSVPEDRYQKGERNLIGQLERPAAGIRTLLRGQGFLKGAMNPGESPTFSELAMDKVNSFMPVPTMKDATGLQKAGNALQLIAGMGAGAVGMGADIVTDPVNAALTLAGAGIAKTPLLQAVKQSQATQTLEKMVNSPVQKLPGMIDDVLRNRAIEQAPKQIDVLRQGIKDAVKTGVFKGVRPTVTGKGTAGRMDDYVNKVTDGVKTIVLNKENIVNAEGQSGQLPKSIIDWAKAIETTKGQIYREYDDMAQAAGKAGATFDSKGIISELKSVAKNIANTPEERSYAQKLIPQIRELDGAGPLAIQERIQKMNAGSKAFFLGRTDDLKQQLDVKVATMMRKELDNIIEKTTGEGYQTLKKIYGSLKAAEKEVNQRAVVAMRANAKSLTDFVDPFATGDIVYGIATANPAQVAKGIAIKGVKEYWKALNNPDKVVEGMFQKVARHMDQIDKLRSIMPKAVTPEIVNYGPSDIAAFQRQVLMQRFLPPAQSQKQIPYQSKQIADQSGKVFGEGFASRPMSEAESILDQQKRVMAGRKIMQQRQARLMLPEPTDIKYGEGFVSRPMSEAESILEQQKRVMAGRKMMLGGKQKLLPAPDNQKYAGQGFTMNKVGEVDKSSQKARTIGILKSEGKTASPTLLSERWKEMAGGSGMAAVMYVGADKKQGETLGQKNNNPINLKGDRIKWNGQTGTDKHGHAIFPTIEAGIRASLRNLQTRQSRQPEQTLREYMRQFKTKKGDYQANYIAKALGISADTALKYIDMEEMIVPLSYIESRIRLKKK